MKEAIILLWPPELLKWSHLLFLHPLVFTQGVSPIRLQLKDVSLGSSRCVDGEGYEPRPMGGECDGGLVPTSCLHAGTRGTQIRSMEANSYKEDLHMEQFLSESCFKMKDFKLGFFFLKEEFLFTY